jgi:hypothetical protein
MQRIAHITLKFPLVPNATAGKKPAGFSQSGFKMSAVLISSVCQLPRRCLMLLLCIIVSSQWRVNGGGPYCVEFTEGIGRMITDTDGLDYHQDCVRYSSVILIDESGPCQVTNDNSDADVTLKMSLETFNQLYRRG